MDQARAGLPALQLSGPQENARIVGICLHGVKPEKNRSPNYHLTATGKPPQNGVPIKKENQSAVSGRAARRKHLRSTSKIVLRDKLLTTSNKIQMDEFSLTS